MPGCEHNEQVIKKLTGVLLQKIKMKAIRKVKKFIGSESVHQQSPSNKPKIFVLVVRKIRIHPESP